MHEGVARRLVALDARETSVTGERVSELKKRAARVLFRVRMLDAVMQVNLHLAPPVMAMPGQTFHQRFFILLSRREIGVTKRKAFHIAPRPENFRIQATPLFKPPFLLAQLRKLARTVRQVRRLEMVCERDDEVRAVSIRRAARHALQAVSR